VYLLVGDKDLESADNLCQWDGLVGLPALCSLCIVNEDDEVVLLALEVDLDLVCFSTSHDCELFVWLVSELKIGIGVVDREICSKYVRYFQL